MEEGGARTYLKFKKKKYFSKTQNSKAKINRSIFKQARFYFLWVNLYENLFMVLQI